MDTRTLRKNLCAGYCAYYKPSKKEELACGGFLAVEKLIEKGIDVAFPVTSNPVGVINQSVENEMRAALCTTCPFFSGDCDFISGEGDAKPCGGFIVLAGLVDKGTMRIDDIRNIE